MPARAIHSLLLVLPFCADLGLASYFLECPTVCKCLGPVVICKGGTIPPIGPQSTQLSFDSADPPITVFSTSFAQHMDHLVTLKLSSVGMTKFESGALGRIPRLTTLNITRNNITALRLGTFENCSRLSSLSLENNNIQVIENGTFMPLTSLVNLSLAQNALTFLPGQLPGQLHLLDLNFNKIAAIPSLALERLITLNLCHNVISKVTQNQAGMQRLRNLCLGGSNFTVTERLVNTKNFPMLESLKLQGGDSGVKITPQAGANIKGMASLRTLELDSCILSDFQLFNQPNSSLENLRVSNLKIKGKASVRSRLALPSVHVFDVSGSPILANFFLTSPAREGFVLTELTTLKMSRCNIKTFDKSVLLAKAPNIMRLDLSHNPLECTCYGLSWIPHYVREDKLSLEGEENTTCASPEHLAGLPLLTATLCPIDPSKETSTTSSTTPAKQIPTILTSSTTEPRNVTLMNKQSPDTTTALPLTTKARPTTMQHTTEATETSTLLGEISVNISGIGRSGSPPGSVSVDAGTLESQAAPKIRPPLAWLGIAAGTLLLLILVVVAVGAVVRNSRNRHLAISHRRIDSRDNMVAMAQICRSQDQLL
ncbi:toll-like receptor 3 [Penaeus indicus]|uniref:toll-like receptor 3 n=1 Tax=Penaeus indicus TaxID=29960 RepID=UPI00300D6B08